MIDNDKKTLQNTLDIINTMPGVKDVNFYDGGDNLVYSSFEPGAEGHIDPNCKNCHEDFSSMFPAMEKAYKIIDADSECKMSEKPTDERHLLIRTPILNERSCYTSACHAHAETDVMLGSLIIKIPLQDLDSAVQRSSSRFFIFATITTLLLVPILIYFTWRAIKKPLFALVNVSRSVANGDRSSRLEVNPGQLDDIEINNPLSGILVYTKLIHKQLSNPELYASKRESMLQHLKMIESETKRCGDIVKGLLDFSRKEQADFEPQHIHEVLQETFELMTHPVKIANIAFQSDFSAKSDLVYCSPNQIKQACVALIVNSTEAIKENGEISLKTSNPDKDTIQIDVTDNGIGIHPDDIPHIFEPFFSTKQGESGIGLGLPIVHGIIQNHKGKIQVKSEPGQGTIISLILPLITS
jgi:two-component system NtrC family sensor kinase